MKTFMLRKEDVNTKWYVIDAEGQNLRPHIYYVENIK